MIYYTKPLLVLLARIPIPILLDKIFLGSGVDKFVLKRTISGRKVYVQMYVVLLNMKVLLFLSYLSLYKAEECTGKGEDHDPKFYRSEGKK